MSNSEEEHKEPQEVEFDSFDGNYNSVDPKKPTENTNEEEREDTPFKL